VILKKILELIPNQIILVPRIKQLLVSIFKIRGHGRAFLPQNKTIVVDLENITEIPLWMGIFPKHTLKFLQENLKPDSLFVDCGANIGLWSILALGILEDGKGTVISYEPNPLLYKRLLDSRISNKIDNQTWQIHEIALSNECSNLDFYLNPHAHQLGTLIKQDENSEKIRIPSKSLDSYSFERLDGMKIDVEGNEINIIKGAIQSLITHKPWLVIELNNNYNNVAFFRDWDVFKLLKKHGYITNFDIDSIVDDKFCKDIIFYHHSSAKKYFTELL